MHSRKSTGSVLRRSRVPPLKRGASFASSSWFSTPRGEPARTPTTQRTGSVLRILPPLLAALAQHRPARPAPLLRPLPAAAQAREPVAAGVSRLLPEAPAPRGASCPPRPPARNPARPGIQPRSGHARGRTQELRAAGSWEDGDSERSWCPREQVWAGTSSPSVPPSPPPSAVLLSIWAGPVPGTALCQTSVPTHYTLTPSQKGLVVPILQMKELQLRRPKLAQVDPAGKGRAKTGLWLLHLPTRPLALPEVPTRWPPRRPSLSAFSLPQPTIWQRSEPRSSWVLHL